MTNNDSFDSIPQAVAEPKKKRRLSVVWIIPVLAAIVALGIAIQRFMTEGPTITITFKKAEGIEPEKTFIRYKEVNIGRVTKVRLSDDYRHVLVTAKIDKSAEKLIVEDAGFWIVQPRITISGISGIGTLLSGNYIAFEPGKSNNSRRNFVGIEVAPVIESTEPGGEYILSTDNLGSLGIGSPVYFRRLNVGQVIGYELSPDGKSVQVKIFVNAPYDRQVKTDTKFWQAGGIDVSVDANGLSVQTQSVLSLLIGGIAFGPPPAETDSKPADANSVFPLYCNRAVAFAHRETVAVPYVLHFWESVRGLSVGAPVTYFGISIGEVANVYLEYDPVQNRITPRVDISVYPERFLKQVRQTDGTEKKPSTLQERNTFVQKQIDGGMRAQLRTSNLLTGQMFVAFDYFPNTEPVKVDWNREKPELPVVPGGMTDLQAKISSILAKIEKMPLDRIGNDMHELLQNIDKAAGNINAEVLPEFGKTMLELKKTIVTAQRLLENTDSTLVGNDAPAKQELREALQEVARAARAISMFTEYLERNPNALIWGKSEEKPR
ncbi:MAG: intermembrane transport protein PqiB [Syntrophobacteraceae bacterium]